MHVADPKWYDLDPYLYFMVGKDYVCFYNVNSNVVDSNKTRIPCLNDHSPFTDSWG